MKALILLLLSSASLFAQLNISNPFFVAGVLKGPSVATWVETDETGLVFHYDYSSTNAGNGNAVTVWPDLSGNNRPMTNSASTVTYQTGGPNGKAYLQWAGNSTDQLANTNSSGFTMKPGTFFIVFQHTSTNEDKGMVGDYLHGFGTYYLQLPFDLPKFLGFSAAWDLGTMPVSGSAGPFGTNWLILTSTYASTATAGDFFVYTNLVVATNGNNDRALIVPTGWSIGEYGSSKGNWRIGRILAYDHVLSGSVRSNLINKAKSDFGL